MLDDRLAYMFCDSKVFAEPSTSQGTDVCNSPSNYPIFRDSDNVICGFVIRKRACVASQVAPHGKGRTNTLGEFRVAVCGSLTRGHSRLPGIQAWCFRYGGNGWSGRNRRNRYRCTFSTIGTVISKSTSGKERPGTSVVTCAIRSMEAAVSTHNFDTWRHWRRDEW